MKQIICILILAAMPLFALSQSGEQLRAQMEQYEAEIAQINKLINSNNTKQKTVSQNVKLITQKIANRKKIVDNLDKQIDMVEKKLGVEGTRVVTLSGELTKLQKDYRALVSLAYTHYLNNSFLAMVKSDNQFSQSFRNITNIDKISQSLLSKSVSLNKMQTNVKAQMVALTSEQERIAQLMKAKGKEVAQLEKEKKQLSVLSSQLQGTSKELKDKEATYRKNLQALQKQIAELIAKESKSETKPIDYALSNEFEQNIGKLPSPVSGGVVVDRFGVHAHPTQAGIKVSNNGINIACSGGSSVKAIFGGEVKRIFKVPSMGNCIIVRHGKFLSVYSNLESTTVKVGDTVSVGQKIGTVDGGQNILHFELWKETEMLNPETWIRI